VHEAITLFKQGTPDVLLLDLDLSDGSGFDIIHHVRKEKLATGIIVLTAFGDKKNVIKAISAGAVGYLLKDEPHQTIEESIIQMLEGGSPITPKIARDILKYFRIGINTPKAVFPPDAKSDSIKLTRREAEILRKIAKGFTCKEISEMEHLSYHTIVTHVRNIYKKLSVNSRAGAVFEAYNLRLI